ncbi:MAG: hypothetical protein AAGA30_20110, partial [Planctomycetota bacterium]
DTYSVVRLCRALKVSYKTAEKLKKTSRLTIKIWKYTGGLGRRVFNVSRNPNLSIVYHDRNLFSTLKTIAGLVRSGCRGLIILRLLSSVIFSRIDTFSRS